ncbi:MAG: carbohydrate ABC transporter permease [Elusimicrobiota bacterium]
MKLSTTKAFVGVAIAIVCVWSLAPFLWQVLTSLKASEEIFRVPPEIFPDSWSIESYRKVLTGRAFGTYVLNSLWVGSWATLICVSVASCAAYAMTRLTVKGTAFWQKFLLAPSFLPPAVLAVPLYQLAHFCGITDKPIALVLAYAALNLPFAIWMLAAFFKHLPKELEEAAMLDGLSRMGILLRIILPVSLPALATTSILVFIFCWNEFVLALTLMSRDATRTVPVGIAMLSGASAYEIPWDQITAAVVMTTMPVVLLVLFFQRQIVSGLTAGAVK